jgi:short-subunit dehydrogenase
MKIDGKNIILTGASSGIGLSLLHKLARFDCRIVAAARTIDRIDLACDNVTKYPCDVSVAANLDSLFEFSLRQLEAVDIFISNAGFAYYEEIEKPSWEHIEKIYETNVFASCYAAQKMKELNRDRPYRVVVTASAMSFLSVPGYSLYASTKAALHGFATGYRFELGRDQKLQVVYPIATETNFFHEAGLGTPVPWPSQSAERVADAIVKGITRDKNSIFPSKLFLTLKILNGYLPFIYPFIAWVDARRLHKWLREERAES